MHCALSVSKYYREARPASTASLDETRPLTLVMIACADEVGGNSRKPSARRFVLVVLCEALQVIEDVESAFNCVIDVIRCMRLILHCSELETATFFFFFFFL